MVNQMILSFNLWEAFDVKEILHFWVNTHIKNADSL